MAVSSMTGFARAAGSNGAWRWAFEINTVNAKPRSPEWANLRNILCRMELTQQKVRLAEARGWTSRRAKRARPKKPAG